jgi:hypothetical protein
MPDELLEDELETTEEVGDYEFDDELAALLEEEDEEARVRRRPVRTGRGADYYRPRVTSRYVTQAQLRSALAKISKDVKANAVAIKTVGRRVDSVAAGQKKQARQLKRDLAKMRNSVQMAAILPLLTAKTITVTNDTTIGDTPVAAGTKLAVAPDTLTALLPMFLIGEGGYGTSANAGGAGGESSSMLFLLLALTGGL